VFGRVGRVKCMWGRDREENSQGKEMLPHYARSNSKKEYALQ